MSPVARRSSTPLLEAPMETVTVTPAGMLIDVKLWMPGVRTVFAAGANAPSAPVLGNGLTSVQTPETHVLPPVQIVPHAPQFELSTALCTSQPLFTSPSQSE